MALEWRLGENRRIVADGPTRESSLEYWGHTHDTLARVLIAAGTKQRNHDLLDEAKAMLEEAEDAHRESGDSAGLEITRAHTAMLELALAELRDDSGPPSEG